MVVLKEKKTKQQKLQRTTTTAQERNVVLHCIVTYKGLNSSHICLYVYTAL